MEEQTKDLKDYISVVRKRKLSIFLIALFIMVISAATAFLLPAVYESSATILIERQEIPRELVMTTVTSYAAERIRVIEAQVMSRTNLFKIIEKFNLYESERRFDTSEQVIERMRQDTVLDVISANVTDPRSGRSSQATIAFMLSYKGGAPVTVQKVASELTTFYLSENLKSRTAKAEETSSFFAEETRRLGNLISRLEKDIAEFKQKHSDSLPELQTLNLQLMQRGETDLSLVESKLQGLQERRFYLESQLRQIQPDSALVPGAKSMLAEREATYATIVSRYSEDHPDVQRLKREIDVLKKESGTLENSDIMTDELARERTKYAMLLDKYTPDHPDVMYVSDKIASLEKSLQQPEQEVLQSDFEDNPDNPAYITLKTQLDGLDIEIRSVKKQLENNRAKQAQLEARMMNAPQVEREYLALKRDYENAIVRYQNTKAKQMSADVAKQLESESKGERFTLIDPPAMPEEPVSPNRPIIMLLGFVLALGGGFGFAFAADAMGSVIHGAKGIQNTLGVLPLSVIPYQINMQDRVQRRKFRWMLFIGIVLAFVAGLLIIHFAIAPLDVLWFKAMRKGEVMVN